MLTMSLFSSSSNPSLPGAGQVRRLGTVVGVIVHHNLGRSHSYVAGRKGYGDRATGGELGERGQLLARASAYKACATDAAHTTPRMNWETCNCRWKPGNPG